ncbi:MAG: hypothetical protein ABMA00_22985, partial [Gemmatimonas sp.]
VAVPVEHADGVSMGREDSRMMYKSLGRGANNLPATAAPRQSSAGQISAGGAGGGQGGGGFGGFGGGGGFSGGGGGSDW